MYQDIKLLEKMSIFCSINVYQSPLKNQDIRVSEKLVIFCSIHDYKLLCYFSFWTTIYSEIGLLL